MCIFHFGLPRNNCTKDKRAAEEEVGRLLVLLRGLAYSDFLRVQNEIYTYCLYLMEHILSRSNYALKYRFSMIFREILDFLPDRY